MNAIVQTLNTAGRAFIGSAVPMLIQSSLLILILLAIDAVLRKRVRAVFRYWIWMLVLVKLVLPPSLWSPVSVGTWFGDTLEVPIAALLEAPQLPSAEEQGQDALATRLSPAVGNFLSQPQPMTVVPPLPGPRGPAAPGWGSITPEGGGATSSVDRPPAFSLNWQGFVLLIWAAVVAALLLLLTQRTFFVRGLVAQAEEASRALLHELDRCRQHLGLRQQSSARLSSNAASPAVCGLWRPVILIPQNLASRLHGAELQAVLFHELAHIKRGDLWINLIQTILQIFYFYNPLLWLANALIRRIREKAVDETVLVAMGESAPQYPDTLINVAKLALAHRPALSLRLIGVVESRSALTSRIKHILNRPLPKTARLGAAGLAAVVIIAAALLPMAKEQREEVGTDKPRLVVVPNCGVSLSDIGGHDLFVLDLASGRILALRAVKNKDEFLQRIEARDEGDILYYYDQAAGKGKITFLRSADLGWESMQNIIVEYKAITIAIPPMETPLDITTRGGDRFKIRITREDRDGCAIEFSPLKDSDGTFKAVLPNGVTVELLGACEFPSEGQQWWRPDGSLLAEAPYDRRGAWVFPNDWDKTPFELALRVRNLPENWEAGVQTPGNSFSNAADPPFKAGRRLPDLRWLMTEAEPNQTTCTIRCNLAAPWQTVARSSLSLAPSQPTPGDGVVFSEVRAGFGGGRVTVSGRDSSADGVSATVTGRVGSRDDGWLFGVGGLQRIVAITKDGKMQTVPSDGFYFTEVAGRATAYFPRLSLSSVREFQFQTRPLTWVEFRNVPLRRGLKTDVTVDVRSADTGADAASPSSTDREKEIVLPDVDLQPQMLDLATAGLLPVPTGSPKEIWGAVEKLGQGDLVYDSGKLILVRRAASPQAHPGPMAPFQTYDIKAPLPVALSVTTAEGRQYKIAILAADDKACALQYSLISTDQGAGGGALAEPDKDGNTLELRIAPRRGELGPDAVEEFTKALAEGRSLADSRCLWVAVQPGMNLPPELVTQTHQGKTRLLVYNDTSLIMVPSQGGRLVHVGRSTDENDRPMLVLRFDEAGAAQMVRLTRAHGGQLLAIIIGGVAVSTPTIPKRQEGVHCATVAGEFTEQALEDMTAALRRGMAEPAANDRGDFRPVKLRNGVTVELLGVCEHPSVGKQWWRPDGSPLAERPYSDDDGRAFPNPGEKGYKLAVRFSGLAGKDVGAHAMPSDAQSTNGGTLDQTSGTNRKKNAQYPDSALDQEVVSQGVAFDQELDSFDLRVGVSRGPWKNEYWRQIGNFSETVEWAIFKDVTLRPQRRTEADKGAGGGVLAAPSKDVGILGFRIAPTPQEVSSEAVEKYKQALMPGGRPPGRDFAWFEVRPGTVLVSDQITCEHAGKTYLLLWNDRSHLMRADGTWGLEDVRDAPYEMDNRVITLTLDEKGVQLLHALGNANLRHSMAVVFEGRVIAIPFISTTLSGTGLSIIGQFTAAETAQIVASLRRVTAASAPEFSGRAADSDGRPVAGAQVALCTKSLGVIVQAGKLTPTTWGGRSSEIVETDAQGRFSFSARPEEFHLVAAHDEGFAWVTNEEWTASDGLRLEPWARIDGTLRIGREPGANKRVDLLNFINKNAIDQGVHFDYHTQTDARGRFAIEKVPPTWMEVGYLIRVGDSMWTDTSRTPIHLQPGENRKMTLGGEGQPVVGRFVPPEGYQGPIYFGAGLRALDTWRPELPKPDNYDQMSRRQQQEWINNWVKTPAAGAFYDTIWHDLSRRHYTFRIREDGTFRIEDVTSGKYNFTVWLEERPTGEGRPEEIGAYHGTVEVPPMAQAYTVEPLDLGNLALKMRQPPLHVGDMAPLFEAKTLDGKDLRLVDYRGKFVLLSFWEPAFHPELDRLEELYKTYGGTGRLRIIGLGGWDTLEEVRKLVAERQIEWPEIYLGEGRDNDIIKQYSDPVASYILLVNPEGQIVATWLRGEKLTEAVEKAIPQP